jgi:hypothetical protein
VALPEAYIPTSTALRVIAEHKTPLHDKAVILEEIMQTNNMNFFSLANYDDDDDDDDDDDT